MSKDLEYIQRRINIVKQQVEGSNIKIIVTDPIAKWQCDYYERELQTLESIESKLKALEIIKEKRIDIEIFYTSFIEGNRNYSFYDIHYGTYGEYCLTEDEFNLLREVLDNGTN